MASENVGPKKNNIEVDRKLINNLVNDKDLKWTKKYANSNTSSLEAKIGGRDASKIQLEDGTIAKMTNDAKGNTVEIHEKPDGTVSASIRDKSKRVTFKIKKSPDNTNRKGANSDRIRRRKASLNRRENRFRNFLERAKEGVTRAGAMAKGLEAIEKAVRSKNKTLEPRSNNTQRKSMRKKSSEEKKPSKTKELLKKAGKLLGNFLKGILELFKKMVKAYRQRKSSKKTPSEKRKSSNTLGKLLKTFLRKALALSKVKLKSLIKRKSARKNTTKSVGKANVSSLGEKLKAAFQSLGKGINALGVSKQKRGGLYEQVFGAKGSVYRTGSLKNNTGNSKDSVAGKTSTPQVKKKTSGPFWNPYPEIKEKITKTASNIIKMKTTNTKRNSGPRMG